MEQEEGPIVRITNELLYAILVEVEYNFFSRNQLFLILETRRVCRQWQAVMTSSLYWWMRWAPPRAHYSEWDVLMRCFKIPPQFQNKFYWVSSRDDDVLPLKGEEQGWEACRRLATMMGLFTWTGKGVLYLSRHERQPAPELVDDVLWLILDQVDDLGDILRARRLTRNWLRFISRPDFWRRRWRERKEEHTVLVGRYHLDPHTNVFRKVVMGKHTRGRVYPTYESHYRRRWHHLAAVLGLYHYTICLPGEIHVTATKERYQIAWVPPDNVEETKRILYMKERYGKYNFGHDIRADVTMQAMPAYGIYIARDADDQPPYPLAPPRAERPVIEERPMRRMSMVAMRHARSRLHQSALKRKREEE